VRPEFATRAAPGELFRIGRAPDVWTWPDWAYVGRGRWDDPLGAYRVLYAAESRLAAFVEVLAPLRPDPELRAQLRRIRSNDRGAPRSGVAGRVPARWRRRRIVGRGIPDGVSGPLVVVGGSASVAALRRRLGRVARRFGLKELDTAAIRLSAPRGFTQEVSRLIYDRVGDNGSQFGGISYLSRHGDDLADCALFERGEAFPVTSLERSDIGVDDEDFLLACEMLGLDVE